MNKLTIIVLPAVLIALLLAAGCGPTPTPTPPGESLEWEEIDQYGVRFTLIIEKSVYHPGESVEVTAKVKNLDEFPLTYQVANLQDPPISVAVDTKLLGFQSLYGPNDPNFVSPVVTTGTIAPGEMIVREVSWNQLIAKGVQAPPGEYVVWALIALYNVETDVRTPLTITATFTVEGSAPIISHEEALSVAVEQPEVSDWYEENGSSVICGSSSRKYLSLIEGELQESSRGEYMKRSSDGRPVCDVYLAPGPIWKVDFRNKTGPSPGIVEVSLDAVNGNVLEVR